MDESVGRSGLPQAYADALGLRESGLSDDEIAERLQVPAAAVASMLSVAEAKLASARATGGPARSADEDTEMTSRLVDGPRTSTGRKRER